MELDCLPFLRHVEICFELLNKELLKSHNAANLSFMVTDWAGPNHSDFQLVREF